MTTHEIIEAIEAPEGDVFLTIRWGDAGHQTTERMSVEAAKALGLKRPDPQPVDPAWMVDVATEAVAASSGRPQPVTEYIVAALRLALSRGHVVLAPVMPSEEEMLKAAREDAAQSAEAEGARGRAWNIRRGEADDTIRVQAALQARRNVYASLGSVAGKAVSSGPAVSELDLRGLANQAWMEGWVAAEHALMGIRTADFEKTFAEVREADVSSILENLKSGEA